MGYFKTFYFFPERLVRFGILTMGCLFLMMLPLLFVNLENISNYEIRKVKKDLKTECVDFKLGLQDNMPKIFMPDLQQELVFYFEPLWQAREKQGDLILRSKKTKQMAKIALPCKVFFDIDQGQLALCPKSTPFGIELKAGQGSVIEMKQILELNGETVTSDSVSIKPQESPMREAKEFAEGSPFFLLGNAQWLGRDLFAETSLERIEIDQKIVDVKQGDWLLFENGVWQKKEPLPDFPIAHVEAIHPTYMIVEGWDVNGYVKFSLTPPIHESCKIKIDELIHSIRVRSEKQISCMLEKQCMILKTGDWVVKTGKRWKVLRQKGDKEGFLQGKFSGELFIFDQISQKHGQKTIQGRLYHPSRTLMVSIEAPVQNRKKKGL